MRDIFESYTLPELKKHVRFYNQQKVIRLTKNGKALTKAQLVDEMMKHKKAFEGLPHKSKVSETKPKETKPKETKPKETKPKETKPKETKPKKEKETKPKETKPKKEKTTEDKEDNESELLKLLKSYYQDLDKQVEEGVAKVRQLKVGSPSIPKVRKETTKKLKNIVSKYEDLLKSFSSKDYKKKEKELMDRIKLIIKYELD